MYRKASENLDRWLSVKKRKPLILRGARQVGKTWLIRDLAERNGKQLIELNFKRSPKVADYFASNDPEEILRHLEAELNIRCDRKNSILFLDEIQAKPDILASLRWFGEDMPELPVVAAGSLLDFILADHAFSMPVGRVAYHYLEPMSFHEFILASGNDQLYRLLNETRLETPIPSTLHEKCIDLYFEYSRIGGMPEVVSEWYALKDPASCVKVQQDLLAILMDDFNKYSNRINTDLLTDVLYSVPRQLGGKFITARVNESSRSLDIKKALDMLRKARICHTIFHTSANGVPLGAESNNKFFKVIMLDTAFVSVQLGLSRLSLSEAENFVFKNRGPMAEQYVGQHIRAFQSLAEDPSLYYWQRTGGRQGEIDYIIQHKTTVVPVEIKSGARGSMKSLHQFMFDKKLDLAVRVDQNPHSLSPVHVKTTLGNTVEYRLLSIPFYLVERLPELLDQAGL